MQSNPLWKSQHTQDGRLASVCLDLDKYNNLKETKQTNVFKMLVETKEWKEITIKGQAWYGTNENTDKNTAFEIRKRELGLNSRSDANKVY